MASFTSPLLDPTLWDVVIVNGVSSPGLAELSDAKRENNWDVKEGPGISGATSTFRGDKLAEFTLTLSIWEQSHWDALPKFLAALKFDSKKTSNQAVAISHPSLAAFDPPIRACVAKEIGAPEREREGDSLFKLTIKLLEFRPPAKKNVTKTANGATSNGNGKATESGFEIPPVITQNNELIGQLNNRFQQAIQ